jgi:8-oxo-dGTP pyrophosphatase MutT (NUDIX family)
MWRRNESLGGQIQILLIRTVKGNKKWGLPKGKIEPDETYEECAVRETFEETGITVPIEALTYKLPECYNQPENKPLRRVICYLVGLSDGIEPAISQDFQHEIQEARWWNIDELPQLYRYQHALIMLGVELIRGAANGDLPLRGTTNENS